MPLNMNNKVSSEDREAVRDSLSTPDMEPGFEEDSSSDEFVFSDLDWDSPTDVWDGEESKSDDPWGKDNNNKWGEADSWGDKKNESPFDNKNNGSDPWDSENKKEDSFDLAIKYTGEAAKTTFGIIKEIYPSLKNRTSDDLGYIGTLSIKVGAIMIGCATILGIIFKVGGIGEVINGTMFATGVAGAILVATGLVEISLAAYLIEKKGASGSLDSIEDIKGDEEEEDLFFNNSDDILSSLEEELFGGSDDNEETDMGFSLDDLDSELDKYNNENNDNSFNIDFNTECLNELVEERKTEFNSAEALDSITENTYICRQTLLDAFTKMLPLNTPEFSDEREISKESEEYLTIDTICIKALANVLDCDIESIENHVESVTETYFCYVIRIKRVRKLTKIEMLAHEIEVYMREDSSDLSVIAEVDVEGDFYKITVSKGVSPVVTLGDMLKQHETYEYFRDEKHKLPVILGIDQNGKLVLDDAKYFNTMMVAGKQRSGKSWYLLGLLMAMMLFNTPEDVLFVIIDPKSSNLFKTISLMPHVFGLHGWEKTLQVMDDLINVEAERRKKLFADNRCDDIWALREKGIKLPTIYLCIDEYMTIKNSLGDAAKELNLKLQIVISQLPSLGIGVIFVPHRATGVVDKTNRTLVQLAAAVKLDTESVKEVLEAKKWDRALTQPGDIGLKTCNMHKEKYVRGLALTDSDAKNTEFIETAAKAFYKMGVDIPDMSHLTVACNRDSENVRRVLYSDSEREQYSYKNVFNDI